MTRNRLDQETSPYLLQHAANPVHWQPWDASALALAREQDRPILLSIGYSACHWCHVMAHESFENPDTASLMNHLYVNIKVDREERPDLDTIHQAALALLGIPGGWPLTMFLTPAGEPFWGGTYFPPNPQYGRPSFREVLRSISDIYRRDPGKVARNRSAIGEALQSLNNASPGEITQATTDAVAAQLLAEIDPRSGGFGAASKFPQTMALERLWRTYKRVGDARYRDAVVLTARNICRGGIYDHLGGGFARYTVDSRWLVPHFEKMLYDNALLIELLTWLWRDTGDPLFARRVAESVAWLKREMIAPEGGFASAFDADSDGSEGAFYVWTAAEIEALLGPDADAFKAAYDVRPGGNWDGVSILNRLDAARDDDEIDFAPARAKLLRARAERHPPARDDKVLADWNGLAITALAEAGAAFDRDDWVDLAVDTFAVVVNHLDTGGRLRHSYRAGQTRGDALLDDYAAMARAALSLYEVRGERAYLDQARAWVAIADRHYWDAEVGGYYTVADDGERLVLRMKSITDSAAPAGNAIMVGVLARLRAITGDDAYRARADAIVATFASLANRGGGACCALLNSNELLRAPTQVVVIGPRDEPATKRLRRAAFAAAAPNRIVIAVDSVRGLDPAHPAAGSVNGGAESMALVCAGVTCSLPITDPDGLRAALDPGRKG